MPFVHQIIPYSSLSVVGLGKNTGKTECLRYIIKRLSEKQKTIAVTSIGIDGESIDRVTATPKPEIHLEKGMYFTTVGAYYLQKRFTAEICHVEENATVLGKMLTARALEQGQLVIAGPTDTLSLQRWVTNTLQRFPVDICLVDGAVSRLSPASPAVTQSMVLATGAAYSAHLKTLVDKTRFVYDILQLPVASQTVKKSLEHITKGIHIVKEDGTVENVGIDSALTSAQIRKVVALGAERLYIPHVGQCIASGVYGTKRSRGYVSLHQRFFAHFCRTAYVLCFFAQRRSNPAAEESQFVGCLCKSRIAARIPYAFRGIGGKDGASVGCSGVRHKKD